MSRNIFGWSYPPGCSGPPDDDIPEPLRCKHCKAFIGGKPIRTEPWEDSTQCDGHPESCDRGVKHEPHKIIWDAGARQIFKCKKCGKETAI